LKSDELRVGSKLVAKHSESLADHLTKGKEYEVVEVSEIGFYILNDYGKKCFPIATTFIRIE
jgi:hypothetical protein